MKKIIVISTDPSIVETLNETLPYNITGAEAFEHPDQLFDQLNRLNPDLVIVDFMLNDLNGSGTTHQIKSDPKWQKLPVVILTEFTDAQMPNKFGSDRSLQKPFKIDELNKLIQTLL